MSKINLTPNAGGTGTLTVTSPNTNTDYTLTLPSGTGTFNISGTPNEVPAGTVSAPSIYFSGDTNTGIYSPGSDTIAFTEGGVEAMRLDSSGNVLVGTTSASTPSSTGFISSANTFGFKNRIINGDMRIDQRNAGASFTPTNAGYGVDRFGYILSQASKITSQRSTVAPTGFTNSLLVTSSAATSVGAGDFYTVYQAIEGFNVADLGWGAAGAKSITISFWVRSSLTGTFGGSVISKYDTGGRYYQFTYSISAANTWEQKTVTIAGDTSGTWLTNNGAGLYLSFSLGVGSTYSATAGSWGTTYAFSPTGATQLVATNGATWYITGVQLEVGTVATSFDYRPYGTELMLCQRYYEKSYAISVTPGTGSILGSAGGIFVGSLAGSTTGNVSFAPFVIPFKVTKRAAPTMVLYDFDGTANAIRIYPADAKKTGVTSVANITETGSYQFLSFDNSSATAITAGNGCAAGWTAAAEL